MQEMLKDPLENMLMMMKELMPGLKSAMEKIEQQFEQIKNLAEDMGRLIES